MTEKKKFLTKKTAIVIAAVVVLAIVAATLYLSLFVDVDTMTLSKGEVIDYYSCEGVIENGGAYHVTSEVGGKVLEFRVRENDVVSADTVIAVIDSTDIARSLAAARAGAGGSAVVSARRAYEVAKELYESGGGSKLAYESALADYQRANAEYAEQAATITRLEDMLAKCEIKAGKAGVVASLPGKTLSSVEAGTEMAVINCEGRPVVRLDVLTNIAPYIKAGDEVDVTISLKGKDEHYKGRVTEVYDYASAGTSALGLSEYRVHVLVDLESDEMLAHRDGYGASIRFCLYSNPDALYVPSSALFTKDGVSYVFKASGGTAKAVPVSVEFNTSSKVVISDGIAEGDEIIVHANTESLEDGSRIR